MSMIGGRFPQGAEEVGQTIASFPTYEAAQKAVSSLIAAEVPARDIAIVGQGLRSVERVTGRLGYASAARSGAINGLLLGLLFSAILVIGSPSVPIQAFVGVLFVGIAIGMLLSIITYSLVRRRRDYASVMQVVADHYEVTVTAASIARARQILGPQSTAESPAAPSPASPRDDVPEPPRYGERVTPAGTQTGAPEPAAPQRAEPEPEPAAPQRAEPEPEPAASKTAEPEPAARETAAAEPSESPDGPDHPDEQSSTPER